MNALHNRYLDEGRYTTVEILGRIFELPPPTDVIEIGEVLREDLLNPMLAAWSPTSV